MSDFDSKSIPAAYEYEVHCIYISIRHLRFLLYIFHIKHIKKKYFKLSLKTRRYLIVIFNEHHIQLSLNLKKNEQNKCSMNTEICQTARTTAPFKKKSSGFY